jgi:hypothetical protein
MDLLSTRGRGPVRAHRQINSLCPVCSLRRMTWELERAYRAHLTADDPTVLADVSTRRSLSNVLSTPELERMVFEPIPIRTVGVAFGGCVGRVPAARVRRCPGRGLIAELDDVGWVTARREQGWSVSHIATTIGVNPGRVRAALREAGLPPHLAPATRNVPELADPA